MLKSTSRIYLLVSVLFVIAAVLMIINENAGVGVFQFIVAVLFFILYLKERDKESDMEDEDESSTSIDMETPNIPFNHENIEEVISDEAFKSYIEEGELIKATKRCRELTKWDLKKAKDFVDSVVEQ